MYSLVENQALTPREYQVVREVALGKSRKEIAFDLGISYGTLDTHLKHIFLKLQTRSMTETAIWAIRHEGDDLSL